MVSNSKVLEIPLEAPFEDQLELSELLSLESKTSLNLKKANICPFGVDNL